MVHLAGIRTLTCITNKPEQTQTLHGQFAHQCRCKQCIVRAKRPDLDVLNEQGVAALYGSYRVCSDQNHALITLP
uniref:Uncharacterized protein n=1 Tax=Timema poppense TaxID=170557 RepID=A0A7R9DUC7_TIMPO|nr:unnamed protein product [Timema poppensis]